MVWGERGVCGGWGRRRGEERGRPTPARGVDEPWPCCPPAWRTTADRMLLPPPAFPHGHPFITPLLDRWACTECRLTSVGVPRGQAMQRGRSWKSAAHLICGGNVMGPISGGRARGSRHRTTWQLQIPTLCVTHQPCSPLTSSFPPSPTPPLTDTPLPLCEGCAAAGTGCTS